MKPNEVPPIERDHDTVTRGGEVEYLGIRDSAARMATLAHRQHIVAEPPQLLDCWLRQVLVRIQASHVRPFHAP